MSHNVLNIQANERVDLADFQFLADEGMQLQARQLGAHILADPAKIRSWIVSGFEASNPAAAQVQVEKGVAILPQREGAEVFYGAVTTEGDAAKIVDMASYSDGAYGIYVRFELVEGASASRIFWNPAGTGSETAQTIPTRRLASWGVRIESSTPGAEWFQIASATKTGGSVSITDERHLYFEGQVDSSYASGWGAGNDRDDDRQQHGIFDFQSFNAATRTRLSEISGEPWYRKNRCGSDLIHKAELGDFFESTMWISGYSASGTGGLGVDVVDGVAYVDDVRVGVSDASPSGTAAITLPDNTSGSIELLSDGTIRAVTGAVTGLELYTFVTSGGSISTLTDVRSDTRRKYEGNLMFSNTQGVYWENSSGALDAFIDLDASDDLRIGLADGNRLIVNEDGTGNLIFEVIGGGGGVARIHGTLPHFSLVETDQTPDKTWTTGVGAGRWFLAENTNDVADRVLHATSNGVGVWDYPDDADYPFQVSDKDPSMSTRTRRFWINADPSTNAPTWAVVRNKGTPDYSAGIVLKLDPSVYSNDFRAYVAASSGSDYAYYTLQNETHSALRYRMFRDRSGTQYDRHMFNGKVFFGGDSGAPTDPPNQALSRVKDDGVIIYTSVDTDTPMFSVQRGTNPSGSGSLDFNVSNTNVVGSPAESFIYIRSQAKDFYVGTWDSRPLKLGTNNALRFIIDENGKLSSNNEQSPDVDPGGLCLYHSGNGRALTCKNSDVSHPFTAIAESDTYAAFTKASAASGGLEMRGFSESIRSFEFIGYADGYFNATNNTTSGCADFIFADSDGGTGTQSFSTSDLQANLMTIQDAGTTRFIFKAGGDFRYDGSASSYDDEQDAIACQDLAYAMAGKFDRIWKYHTPALEKIGVMENGFVSLKNSTALVLGGIGELYQVLNYALSKIGLDYETIRKEIRTMEASA